MPDDARPTGASRAAAGQGRYLGVTSTDPADFVDLDTAARRLGVHPSIVVRLVERGHLARAGNGTGDAGVSAESLAALEDATGATGNWLTRPILELAAFLARITRSRA